ncbi:MAG: hypothetical protein JWM61_194 [Micrococcaceae bacterium]|nr:hypothetical protein [Micrococcaceae bacterium]
MTTQPRFMTLTDVAEELALSRSQIYVLATSGDLPAGGPPHGVTSVDIDGSGRADYGGDLGDERAPR